MAAGMIFHTRDLDRWIDRCHPLSKLALLLVYCIAVNIASPVYALVLSLALAAACTVRRIPLAQYVHDGPVFAVLAVFIMVSELLQGSGILISTVETLRFAMSLLASLAFIDCTSIDDLASALGRLLHPVLGRHACSFASAVQLTLSMIPMIFDTAMNISQARKARGASFLRHPVRSTGELTVSLVSQLLDGVADRADALIARSYDPYRLQNVQSPGAGDIPLLAILVAITGGLLWTSGL